MGASKRVPTDLSHSWDKLFTYIQTGDLQRVLALYRLLASTIKDEAYAQKLKADILWVIKPEQAAQSYVSAAELYEQDGRLVQAHTLIKMLTVLEPEVQEYHLMCVKLQRVLDQQNKKSTTQE